VILILVALGAGAWRFDQPGPNYPSLVYLLLLGLAIGPQLLGHTAFNWSLRHLSATFVAIATLGEPVGAALLALIFFKQGFEPIQLLGFVVLLMGIAVAARGERGESANAQTQGDTPVEAHASEIPLTR
jgi:drug/metabolite transporter (DMT)-like permease